jgi:hypothetical protein
MVDVKPTPMKTHLRLSAAFFACLMSCHSFAADAGKPVDPQHPWAAPTDRAAVVRELRDVSAAGIDRRFGPGFDAYHTDDAAKNVGFPEIYLAPSKQDPGGRRYQIGGPWTKSGGDFSSTQGQVLYVPSDPAAFPVDRVTISEWSNGTWSERPEAPWHGGFRPEPASKKWLAANNGKPLGVPIAEARGYGAWCNCGVAVFSSGFIGTAGTVTARGLEPTLQLPPSKIPTAVSITNKAEFALVTIVDTETHKGQLAVIAMQVNGKKTRFVHEWQFEAWCMPSVGLFTDMKLLGYIDLPGMEFPTGVCAVGNHEGGRMNGRDGNAGLLREYDIAKQADRDVFFKGSNAQWGSSAGYAVVISKYENKAAFVDLQPLFARVREMYFTTEENYQKAMACGQDPKQWPMTFDADPSWKPAVVTTIDVPTPTACLATLSGGDKARAFIASLDGKLEIYSVSGLATEAEGKAGDVARISEVQVGRNPTRLTYQKGSRETIIACSRGDREISWIKFAGKDVKAPTVIRRLRDARLLDPVDVEVSDTHGVSAGLLTAVDFKGKQIVNYRYTEVKFATQGGAKFGMGADGKAEFECGGIMEIPGNPVGVSASNVN